MHPTARPTTGAEPLDRFSNRDSHSSAESYASASDFEMVPVALEMNSSRNTTASDEPGSITESDFTGNFTTGNFTGDYTGDFTTGVSDTSEINKHHHHHHHHHSNQLNDEEQLAASMASSSVSNTLGINPEKPLFIGLNMPGKHGCSDQATLDSALAQGYDMITSRITNKKYKNRILKQDMPQNNSKNLSPGHGELCVFPGKHVKNTIALAAPWIELDSKDAELSKLSYQVLYNEVKHADFCAFKYVVISGPRRRTHVAQYAESIQKLCLRFPDIKILLHLPFTEEYTVDKENNVATPPADLLSVWEVWNTIRVMCNYPMNLALALQMPRIVPPDFVVSRWFADPVAMLVFTPRTFVRNAKNYPVLSKTVQRMLYKFFTISPFLIIEEDIDKETGTSSNGFVGGRDSFLKYLRHLHMSAPEKSPLESYGSYVADVLQKPIQPSSQDLEAAFYEVFEIDSVKYSQYEKALFYAMFDRPDHSTLTVAVAGAGRGPLVDCCIRAARAAGNRSLNLYVFEKNSSAVVLLEKRLQEVWSTDSKHNIHLIHANICDWTPPSSVLHAIKFDIIVSELLGSFGDNELSPECLDNIQQYLATDGVMIPQEYRSYLQPIFSPSVWASARNSDGTDYSSVPRTTFLVSNGNSLEKSYVVFLQQADTLSSESKLAWTFQHPNNGKHERFKKLSFRIPNKGVMHGLAGYFEAVLYRGIELSTRPETYEQKSNNLLSWFPIYFPLSQPLTLVDDSEAMVSIWRRCTHQSAWYEWVVESQYKKMRLSSTMIHNSGGMSLSFRLK